MMRNTLPPLAFNDLFDGVRSFGFFIAFVVAVTTERLFVANRASFGITHVWHMILTLDYRTVMTRLTIRAPVVRFVAVTNSFELFSVDDVKRFELSFLDLFGPLSNHPNPVVDYVLLSHRLQGFKSIERLSSAGAGNQHPTVARRSIVRTVLSRAPLQQVVGLRRGTKELTGQLLATVTAFRKISINDRDQVSQILISAHLRIHKSIDLYIYIFKTFKRDAGETSHDLFGLYLNFTQLLNIRTKLRLLLNDESYSSVDFFVAHGEETSHLI
jgi:hypothetical protein